MKRPSITIILPTYNEAENIALLISEIQKCTPSSTDILVVDDNSPDGTASRVQKTKHIKLLVRTKNRGLTNSIKAGISASTGDIVVWMDGDFSHPPNIISRLVDSIENGADVALAARMHTRGLSRIINSMAMLLFGNSITDYTTGFLAVRRRVLNRISLQGTYGEYCIDLLVRARRMGFSIKEISYDSPPRLYGTSKTTLRYGVGYIKTVLRLLWTSEK